MSSNNIETLLKSPSVESTHKQLYKSGSTPWKETYRKRCRERLAESRQKFVDRLRNCGGQDSQSLCDEFSLSVREAVIEEFINRKEEIFQMKEYNITEALATLDEITKEIMQETENTEQQILAEYEANLHLDEAMLCASIECLSTEDVLCPVCEKSPLAINKGVVSCQCGIVIDTEQDAVTLNMIKANLSEGLTDHSSACNNIPRFSVVNQLCMSNLLMTCEACDFFYIII